MDFVEYNCPVCGKQFTRDDDIVVCPECGAPHHRECYETQGRCFFEDRHKDGFSFENENTDNSEGENTVICKSCGAENPKEMFYCSKCGAPLSEQERRQAGQNQGSGQSAQNGMPFGMPFGMPQQTINPFDPMAGFKNDEIIAENVTAGEMSKFVGKSTQYYLRIFNVITKYNNSRFNFSAFIFSGMFFLYRKMLVLGGIFSFLLIGLTVAEAYVQMLPAYQNVYSSLLSAMNTGQYISLFNIPGVSTQEIMFALLPGIFGIIKLVLMIVSGAIANRCYYKHCVKRIGEIKKNSPDEGVNKALEAKGGVNLPLALCIGVAYIIVTYIPIFL